MREMKNSGIIWLNNIPKSWKIMKCKQFCTFYNGYSFDSKDFVIDYQYPIIRIGDIKSGNIDYDNCLGINNNANLNNYRVRNNDILLAMSGATVGKVGLVTEDKDAYINQRVGIIRTKNPKYLFYYLNTKGFMDYITLISNGSAQPNISSTLFSEFSIALPTNKEQKLISNFLDKKCSELDTLTKDIQQQISQLEEYKKSIITEAVTKGLNPNVEMKDSGIEWIGNIPVDWDVIKIKHTSTLKGRIGWQGLKSDEFYEDSSLPYLITGTDFKNGSILWNSCYHITNERFKQDINIHIKENDLLITKDGTIGKLAIVTNCPPKVSLNSGVMIIRNDKEYKYKDKFLYYILSSDIFGIWFVVSNKGNSTIQHLTQEKFINFSFPFPNIHEQTKIANYLDKKCDEINNIISSKKKQLIKLEEYKKSMIYEYVTGKKEVL